MITATVADGGWIGRTLSPYMGGDNLSAAPVLVKWKYADPQTARFVTDEFIPQAKGKGQIGWLLEPFFLHPDTYLTAMSKNFDYVLSHDDNFIQNSERWLWYPAGGSRVALAKWKIYPKTKDVSLLTSNKKMTYGHTLRLKIAERYGDKIDVTRIAGGAEYVRPITCLEDYRFSVILENEKSRYWFTEKLIDCFATGTIPIYRGCPDIGNFFDAGGIIEFDNLADFDLIIDWLQKPGIAEETYKTRLSSIQKNIETARLYCFCDDWIYRNYPFLF